jgi:hypothetical protein
MKGPFGAPKLATLPFMFLDDAGFRYRKRRRSWNRMAEQRLLEAPQNCIDIHVWTSICTHMHVYASMRVHGTIDEGQAKDRSERILYDLPGRDFLTRWRRQDAGNSQKILPERQVKGQKEGAKESLACPWLLDNRPSERLGSGRMTYTCTASNFRADSQPNPTQNG